RMTDALRHRGPDGAGLHVAPGIGLGHRRLAVIDLDGGAQPMFNEDGSVAIVFNGEIYNHAALRPELMAAGHVFRSHSDTEAIIHAWEQWGPACLQRFSGMFAFAVWDRRRRSLFIARDRLGKKPLHYGWTGRGDLVFASELGALAHVPGLSRALDPAAVADYFAYGHVQDPATIYRDIRKLPAAHYLLLTRDAPPGLPVRYWDARETQVGRPDADEAAGALRARLRDAVRARMIADVPLGGFLSGGLDSSAVVALAAGLRPEPLSTFTIGFAGRDDERPAAADVARHCGADHHADIAAVDYIRAAAGQAAIYGEPFGDSSAVPTLEVCVLARRHVTVALSGDGGDEVFGGYRRHRWHVLTEAVRRHVPAPLRRRVLGELARAYPKLDRAPRWLRARNTLTELSLDSAQAYYRMLCRAQDAQRAALFSGPMRDATRGHDPGARITALMDEMRGADPLAQAQYVDIRTYLVGDILTKVDRASMAHSLEVRCPLLDHDLLAWGLALPASMKLRGGAGKHVLREAMADMLPAATLARPKQGFATSLAAQFRQRAGQVRQVLCGARMRDSGMFDAATLARLIDEHAAGRMDHSAVLWLLLVFDGFLAHPGGAAAMQADRIAAHA
ncbi:asparagine synthase (glutamine-hydrolyzing), partial [Acidisphaera rubrifaciens]|uniref:asparagine synthase (glutamine-hydrolyzing) n=1 Tax=Acidisphaera rubrifaciens TaxID=50715 RepID=UPI000662802D